MITKFVILLKSVSTFRR